jgi:spore coat polysaccharide biosynthesis protein SpsF
MKFGGKDTLLEFIIERSLSFGLSPIVCTSVHESDNVIEKIAVKCQIPCYRGSLDNKIKRWFQCARHYKMSSFHTIDADDPYFDGERMLQSLALLKRENLDYLKPSKYSDSGGATEGYSIKTDFLENIVLQNSDDDRDTEMAVFYFDKVKDAISSIMQNPDYCINIDTKIPRLTLDYHEDYIMLNTLFYVLKSTLERKNVEEYLLNNNDIARINLHLNAVWKERQMAKKYKSIL